MKTNYQKITECKNDCPVHKLFTHNTCVKCTAFKNSPYHKEMFPNAKKYQQEAAE